MFVISPVVCGSENVIFVKLVEMRVISVEFHIRKLFSIPFGVLWFSRLSFHCLFHISNEEYEIRVLFCWFAFWMARRERHRMKFPPFKNHEFGVKHFLNHLIINTLKYEQKKTNEKIKSWLRKFFFSLKIPSRHFGHQLFLFFYGTGMKEIAHCDLIHIETKWSILLMALSLFFLLSCFGRVQIKKFKSPESLGFSFHWKHFYLHSFSRHSI